MAEDYQIYNQDSFEVMQKLADESFDMIFADPPYMISNVGTSCQNGKLVSINKGKWDYCQGVEANFEFHKRWLKECQRLLKPNGTLWVSGTYHSIHPCGYAMQQLGYHILNDVIWFKPNASPNLSLQVGDRLTVVGKIEDIERLAEHLGNSMQRLNQPNIFTIFIGILIGIVFGSIPFAIPGMPVPLKLGLAGGPLIVAILIGRYGYKMGLTTYTSTSANLMLREVGICMFLASVGIGAGSEFVATVKSGGLMWILWGFLITFIPLLIVGLFGRGYYKLNYYTLSGLMAGSYTDPPALAYSNKVANNDAPAVAYSTVYPLSMFLRVLTAQILVLAFA